MGGLLSTKPTPAPAIPPPAPMPTPDDSKVLAAKKKAQAAAQTRGGRASTILTSFGSAKSEKLGG